MGLAAIFVGAVIALAIAAAIIYGTYLGLAQAGRFLWRTLVPEAAGRGQMRADARPPELPCWEDKGCPASARDSCPVLQQEGLPCWLAKLRAQGRLPTDCLTCNRFSVADLVA